MNKKINIWTDMAELVENQLNLQVKMQFDFHHQFMLNNGLSECQSVMDVGTGNGAFLSELSKAHPNISFVGVDDKEHMVDRASRFESGNISCQVGDVYDPKAIQNIDQVDGLLMRYVLLHIDDASSVVRNLYEVIKPGAKLWIIDLDLEHYECRPQNEAFDLIKGLLKKFCGAHGKDCNIGSKLVGLLENAGFKSIEQEFEPLDTDHVDMNMLQQFIRQEVVAYQAVMQNILSDKEFDKIMNFIDDLSKSNTYLNYGVTLVSALK